MTVTYTDESRRDDAITDEVFVPRYARTGKARRGKGHVRTWMILAPVGALALLGGGAALMTMGEDAAPLTSSGAPAGAVDAAAPLESSTPPATIIAPDAPSNVSITPEAVVRETPPAPPPVLQRRQSDVAVARAPEPRVTTAPPAPAEPAGPQPYTAALNRGGPAESPTRAPAITPSPFS